MTKPKQTEQASPGSRAEKATIDARVEEILRIRLDGAEWWDVRQFVTEKQEAGLPPWAIPEGGKPVSERQLYRYMRAADRMVRESLADTRPKVIRDHIAKRRALYARAVRAGDFRSALSILDSLAKLQGLFPDPARDLLREVEALRKQIEEAEARRVAPAPAQPSP
jgi:hypothetical protein